jgi:predicted nucleic acid-binding protein
MLQFLTGARCFDLNLNAVKKAAEISALLDSKGKYIETMDALIAGIVLSNGFTDLMTKNKSHFENIPDLHIFDYENNEK